MNKRLVADSDLIHWLLFDSGLTRYRISKEAKVPDNTLSDLATGKTKIERVQFITVAKLTEYAEQIKKDQE